MQSHDLRTSYGSASIHRPDEPTSYVVRSLRAGVQLTLDPSGDGGKVGLSSLSGISKRAPLCVAYCLTKPELALVQRQPRPVHYSAPGPDWHLLQCQPHQSAVQRPAT